MVQTVLVLTSFALVSSQDLFLEKVQTVLDARGPVHSCMQTCLKKDDDKHYKKCEEDGSTDCSKSKCCQVITDTCYVKNPYWSSCQPSCKKGHVDQYGDKWDCTPLSPSGCHHLQDCMDKCHSGLEGENNSTALEDADMNLDVITDAEPEDDPELAEEAQVSSVATDCNGKYADESTCNADSACVWCKSAAVKSACNTVEDAAKLPSSIFECKKSEDEQLSLTSTGPCTGNNKEVCKKSCKTQFKDNDYIEHVCEVLCDKNCPDAPPKKCPNKKGLTACVSQCKKSGTGDDHGSHCEKDGATSCLSSKCCQQAGAKCFTKNPYWAACTSECTKGKRNPLDNQIWDCKELKPKQVCDPYKYRKCVDTCVDQC